MKNKNSANNTIGSKIVFLRNQKKMSQIQLATKIGITQESISSIECGKSYPKTETLIKIAEIFGCSLDYLVGISEVKMPAICIDLLDSHQKHLIKNYKGCNRKNKELLILFSDILSNNNILIEFSDGNTIIKNFMSDYEK